MKLWLYIQQADLSWDKWQHYDSLQAVRRSFPGYGWAAPNKEGVIWGISPNGTAVKLVRE